MAQQSHPPPPFCSQSIHIGVCVCVVAELHLAMYRVVSVSYGYYQRLRTINGQINSSPACSQKELLFLSLATFSLCFPREGGREGGRRWTDWGGSNLSGKLSPPTSGKFCTHTTWVAADTATFLLGGGKKKKKAPLLAGARAESLATKRDLGKLGVRRRRDSRIREWLQGLRKVRTHRLFFL